MSTTPATGGQEATPAIRAWFAALARCVGDVDYAAGRELFAPEVVSFGTRAEIVAGIDALQAQQWSGVWPYIADFAFDLAHLHVAGGGDYAWAAVPWSSTGFSEDGEPYSRPGRATVAFERRGGRWLALHTHFSLSPGTPQRSYGRRGARA